MTTEFTARMRLVARLSALFSLILVSIHFEKSSNFILRRVLRSAIAIALVDTKIFLSDVRSNGLMAMHNLRKVHYLSLFFIKLIGVISLKERARS